MPLVTLPVELWETILDSILENIVNPVNRCDHMNFIQIDHQMRAPEFRPPIDRSYRRLRLVCRFFNDLLSSPPYLVMRKTVDQLQRSVRAVYLRPGADGVSCLKSLTGHPSTSHRIVSLDLMCDYSNQSRYLGSRYGDITLDFLCHNSHSLSAVRYLGLCNIAYEITLLGLQFWAQINDAFPFLVCLALRSYFEDETGYIPMPAEAGGTVIFEKLRILELDQVYLYNGLHMPQLQHVALGRCSQSTITTLARSRHLESALFRQTLDNLPLDLGSLPDLKLLGIPHYGEGSALPFPRSYPSTHLCVHVPFNHTKLQSLPKWLVRAFEGLPQVSQVTLDIVVLPQWSRSYMEGDFLKDLESTGLLIQPFSLGTPYMVIERAPVVEGARVEQDVGPDSVWRRWATFLHRPSPKA